MAEQEETFTETLARFRKIEDDARLPNKASTANAKPVGAEVKKKNTAAEAKKAAALKALRTRKFDANVRWYSSTEKRVRLPSPHVLD